MNWMKPLLAAGPPTTAVQAPAELVLYLDSEGGLNSKSGTGLITIPAGGSLDAPTLDKE